MTCTLQVAWDKRLADYHFGPDHPLAPVRVDLTMRLAHEFGLWSQPGVTMAAPALATDADLQLVHDARYVTNVKTVSRWAEHPGARGGLEETQLRTAWMFGLGTEDPDPCLVAGPSGTAHRPGGTRAHDGRRTSSVRAVRIRLQPVRSGRPGDQATRNAVFPSTGLCPRDQHPLVRFQAVLPSGPSGWAEQSGSRLRRMRFGPVQAIAA